jgi:hypothetical protein
MPNIEVTKIATMPTSCTSRRCASAGDTAPRPAPRPPRSDGEVAATASPSAPAGTSGTHRLGEFDPVPEGQRHKVSTKARCRRQPGGIARDDVQHPPGVDRHHRLDIGRRLPALRRARWIMSKGTPSTQWLVVDHSTASAIQYQRFEKDRMSITSKDVRYQIHGCLPPAATCVPCVLSHLRRGPFHGRQGAKPPRKRIPLPVGPGETARTEEPRGPTMQPIPPTPPCASAACAARPPCAIWCRNPLSSADLIWPVFLCDGVASESRSPRCRG